ncbi:exodeoxyribonuclease VII large subunit [Maritalea mediterranea]|uniref:Exodeoxyribonuclease 7 large subunit n=1 Tax=Maritalea mediterranea TaxID=2909667 RepID=A0ABS9E6B1_9HYPH|nr:exodeoxyribonuclease VII large subunit [Maritalea mediterranea]MCF4097779.1 exodeoxyribonuclease VII large subunit [Maritalea mediterranea]
MEEQTGAQASNAHEFTVSEISQSVKRTIEDQFGHVRIRGEVTGYRGPHSSGHAYFALKDEKARIEAVIWRGKFSRLRIKPEEGMEVIATGKLTTYPGSSKYQLVIDDIEPAGAGALMALLEQRRKQLAAEGLFDAGRKQELPYLPQTIGVITSPTGAVIRDILHRLDDRFPTHVIVWPVRVQGETCGPEVANAINGFNALPADGPIKRPDLLIVARGGGSIEDLWGFNEEEVVRAAAASTIPLISAVGHETDITLIDYAADKRAPTPTGAAEMAVPVKSELINYVLDQGTRLRAAQARNIATAKDRLRAVSAALPKAQDLTNVPRQRFDMATMRLGNALNQFVDRKRASYSQISARLSPHGLRQKQQNFSGQLQSLSARLRPAALATFERKQTKIENLGKLLDSLSHKKALERGFALVTDAEGNLVRSATTPEKGEGLNVQFADGDLGVIVADAPPAKAKPKSKPKPKADAEEKEQKQKSLF